VDWLKPRSVNSCCILSRSAPMVGSSVRGARSSGATKEACSENRTSAIGRQSGLSGARAARLLACRGAAWSKIGYGAGGRRGAVCPAYRLPIGVDLGAPRVDEALLWLWHESRCCGRAGAASADSRCQTASRRHARGKRSKIRVSEERLIVKAHAIASIPTFWYTRGRSGNEKAVRWGRWRVPDRRVGPPGFSVAAQPRPSSFKATSL
jgi:hypothetical protein